MQSKITFSNLFTSQDSGEIQGASWDEYLPRHSCTCVSELSRWPSFCTSTWNLHSSNTFSSIAPVVILNGKEIILSEYFSTIYSLRIKTLDNTTFLNLPSISKRQVKLHLLERGKLGWHVTVWYIARLRGLRALDADVHELQLAVQRGHLVRVLQAHRKVLSFNLNICFFLQDAKWVGTGNITRLSPSVSKKCMYIFLIICCLTIFDKPLLVLE